MFFFIKFKYNPTDIVKKYSLWLSNAFRELKFLCVFLYFSLTQSVCGFKFVPYNPNKKDTGPTHHMMEAGNLMHLMKSLFVQVKLV